MAYLRAYMAASRGVLPGRGQRQGDPFIGGLIGLAAPLIRKLGGGAIGRVAGKAVAKITGKPSLVKAAKAAGGFGSAVGAGIVGTKLAGGFGGSGSVVRRYRRMNAGNAKALRRAVRRMESFGKLAASCGYVRRKPAGWSTRRKTSSRCK